MGRCKPFDPHCLKYLTDECGACLHTHKLVRGRCHWWWWYHFQLLDSVLSNININILMKKGSRGRDPSSTMLLVSLMANMQLKRKSWCMQLLKQFILFPDETDSSQKTVSRYDRLIFSDEEIHTMYKKLETKLLQR